MLGASLLRHTPELVWNASASAPVGLYLRLAEAEPKRGDLVLLRPPPKIAEFAAARGYLPKGVPLIKRIVALSGDTICMDGHEVLLNGRRFVQRLDRDTRGRILPHWSRCRTLAKGQLFPVMRSVPDSFDGRYFGPLPISAIEGRMVPIWTW